MIPVSMLCQADARASETGTTVATAAAIQGHLQAGSRTICLRHPTSMQCHLLQSANFLVCEVLEVLAGLPNGPELVRHTRRDGHSPLSIAQENGHEACVTFLHGLDQAEEDKERARCRGQGQGPGARVA